MERQMTEAVTITNEELAILCNIVAGWSVKKAESLDRSKQQVLDRLMANGFVEQVNGVPLQNTGTPPKPISFSPNFASE
jgi:hypothetical protein